MYMVFFLLEFGHPDHKKTHLLNYHYYYPALQIVVVLFPQVLDIRLCGLFGT